MRRRAKRAIMFFAIACAAGVRRKDRRREMRVGSLMMVVTIALTATAAGRAVTFDCFGLQGYTMKGTYDIDWGWGYIRSRDGHVVIGFSIGPMVQELVPAARPPGLRSFKTERINRVTLRYGYNSERNQFQATLIGAPIQRTLNLFSPPKDAKSLLAIARILATAPCHRHFKGFPELDSDIGIHADPKRYEHGIVYNDASVCWNSRMNGTSVRK